MGSDATPEFIKQKFLGYFVGLMIITIVIHQHLPYLGALGRIAQVNTSESLDTFPCKFMISKGSELLSCVVVVMNRLGLRLSP